MESPLEVLSRVAFMVNKTMPPPGDYANPHKYSSQLGRFTCWRANKDLAELRRSEQSDAKRTAAGVSRPAGGRGSGSFAAVAPAPDRRRREEDVGSGVGKLVQREQRDVASRDHRRTDEAPLSEDSNRLGGRSRDSILRCVNPTRASPDCLASNDFGLIFVHRSPTVVGASCTGGTSRDDVQPIANDDEEDVEPLNLSVRRRESTSPARQSSPGIAVDANRHAGPLSAADPEVEEHFRRSLGQRYPKGERVRNGEVGNRSHIAASVEEHFLKSLGNAWFNAADGEASSPAIIAHAGIDTETSASAALLVPTDGPAPSSVDCYPRGVAATAGYPTGTSALLQMAIVDGRKRSRAATADREPSLDCRRKSTTQDCGLHLQSRRTATPSAEMEDCGKDENESWNPTAKRRCTHEEQPITVHSRRCRDGADVTASTAEATTPAAVSPTPTSPAAAASPALASPAAAIGIACDARNRADELTFPEQRQSSPTSATLPDSTTVGGSDDGADPRPLSVGGHTGQAAERSLSPSGRATSAASSATPSAAADAASVDEHFAKALGSKWAEIKRHLSAPPQATVWCERL